MPKILIADDSALARAFMIRCIQITGIPECEFIESSNGLEVINILKDLLPDLIVTDMNMPKCDGIELVKRIKANPRLNSVPIIVMTSAGNAAQRTELENLGVDSIISKPFTPPDVVNIANKLLGNNNNEEGEW
ncbi:MAG: response regulator [Chitinispirillales bacterium]|jgi:CheY-like chemotaxis protein|nr:response regulator [Chitinispirillales bacterium]